MTLTLRKKTLAIISATFLGLIVILHFTTQTILLDNYAELEERDTTQNLERLLSALSNDISYLETTVDNWAARDDTYAFIEEPNKEYIESNLSDEAFITLRLNLIMYIDSSYRTVFSKAFDLDNEEEKPAPNSLREHLSPNGLLLSHADTESRLTGVILLPEHAMLIASSPILTSQEEGPIRGTMLMGRYLHSGEIERLSEQTLLSLSQHRVTDTELPSDLQMAYAALSKEAPILIQPLDEQSIAGYIMIEDIYGKPALVLKATMPRELHQQGKVTLAYAMWSIVGISLIMGLVTIILVEKQILSRLLRLDRSVSNISISGDVSSRVLVSGGDELSRLASSINDMLTALEQSQIELQENDRKYREFADSLPQAVFELDDKGNFTFVNSFALQILGHNLDDAHKRFNPLELTIKEDWDRIVRRRQSMVVGRHPDNIEITASRKDGSTFPAILYSAPIIRLGKVVGARGIVLDITERKQAEEKVKELYETEKKLREQLEDEINKRVEFTRVLVHELRTPLTAVMASSELLAAERQEEPWLSLATNIYRSSRNLNDRIGELLDLARGEVGILEIDPKPTDMLQLLHQVTDDMIPVVSSHKQSLTSELPSALPAISADEDRLRQVLLNLLDNASKFTPEGGKIILRAKEEDTSLVVEVQDTGPGIAKREQDLLFEPYSRLKSTRNHFGGLGLGLALSKTLVELHRGQIWVKSQKGKGSTFGFTIPLATTSKSKDI